MGQHPFKMKKPLSLKSRVKQVQKAQKNFLSFFLYNLTTSFFESRLKIKKFYVKIQKVLLCDDERAKGCRSCLNSSRTFSQDVFLYEGCFTEAQSLHHIKVATLFARRPFGISSGFNFKWNESNLKIDWSMRLFPKYLIWYSSQKIVRNKMNLSELV